MLRRFVSFPCSLAFPSFTRRGVSRLPPPTRADIQRMSEAEAALLARIATLREARNLIRNNSYSERKEAADVLESMKDRYVTLIRQRTMIGRAIARRQNERNKILKAITKPAKRLQSSCKPAAKAITKPAAKKVKRITE